MQQVIEFATNHALIVAALGAAMIFVVTTEIRLRSGAKAVTAQQLVRLMNDENAIVLDVRETAEYKTGHILNARNIPLSRLSADAGNMLKDKAKPIVVYCKTSNRSGEACKLLMKEGYQQVFQLKNGYFAWQEANLPVEK